MDYAILVLSAVSLITCLVILLFIIKNRKTGDITLGDNELKKIRDSINEATSNLSNPISSLIAEKNSTLMSSVNKNVDDLIKKMNDLIKLQSDLNTSQIKFKEDVINLVNENYGILYDCSAGTCSGF